MVSLLVVFTVLLSSSLTYVIICCMKGGAKYDMPDHRSSHSAPTPTSGGLAILVGSWLGLGFAYGQDLLSLSPLPVGLLLASLLSMVGFFDDMFDLKRRMRFMAQIILVVIALAVITLQGLLPQPIYLFFPLLFLWLWLINLFNFMDGINGIAGVQFVSVSAVMAFFVWQMGMASEAIFTLLLSAAVLGFLVWNFPWGKIFMGDVGSYFLGFTLGFLWLYTGLINNTLLIIWLIMLSVFILDASMTLLRRMMLGERFLSPHNQHMYQILARWFDSHAKVSCLVLVYNLCWLMPLSYALYLTKINALVAIFLAYFPITLLWLYVRVQFEKTNLVKV
ncbi:MAG: glycosyltransferase family 4 protein [Cellvibrionales bacterium]|nr:glycosyltransferase family 4 protein [Cellvibrionales bacterium]